MPETKLTFSQMKHSVQNSKGKLGLAVGAVVVTTQGAFASLAAPDTTAILTAIGLFGLAAITIKLTYIAYPIVMKAVGTMAR